eukprot:Platyproteum_vivax@DN3690_c0_g1_i1.p1
MSGEEGSFKRSGDLLLEASAKKRSKDQIHMESMMLPEATDSALPFHNMPTILFPPNMQFDTEDSNRQLMLQGQPVLPTPAHFHEPAFWQLHSGLENHSPAPHMPPPSGEMAHHLLNRPSMPVAPPERSKRKVQTYIDMLERFMDALSKAQNWRQTGGTLPMMLAGLYANPLYELTGNESEPDLWHLVGHQRFVAMMQTFHFFREFIITSDRAVSEYERTLTIQKNLDNILERLAKLDNALAMSGVSTTLPSNVSPQSPRLFPEDEAFMQEEQPIMYN